MSDGQKRAKIENEMTAKETLWGVLYVYILCVIVSE